MTNGVVDDTFQDHNIHEPGVISESTVDGSFVPEEFTFALLDRLWLNHGWHLHHHLRPTVPLAPELRILDRSLLEIGDGCRIGGYSLLTAGTVIDPGQTLKALSLSPPFTHWRAGRRAKIAVPQ